MRRVVVALAVVAAAGCSSDAHLADPVAVSVAETPTTDAPPPPACTAAQADADPTRSYEPVGALPPPGSMPAGSTMARIAARGRMIVGVSGDTLLFGARNPISGAIEGFDIDMLKAVATAIFGPSGPDKIEYRVINYAQRLPMLEAGPDRGGVDIVAHTMTINCNRWLRIGFSSTYFDAGQRILVRTGSGFAEIEDLVAARARVCAPEGSTNIDEIRKPAYAGLEVIAKPDITDCLVAMQQGQADATTGDDTVLAGFAAQDPNTEVVGRRFTSEPYGLGVGKGDVGFVRFVNGVLATMRADGSWKRIYQRWLVDTGALAPPIPEPPVAVYGRPL